MCLGDQAPTPVPQQWSVAGTNPVSEGHREWPFPPRLWATNTINKPGLQELTVAGTALPFLPAPTVLPSWERTMNLVVLSVFPFSVQVMVAGGSEDTWHWSSSFAPSTTRRSRSFSLKAGAVQIGRAHV